MSRWQALSFLFLAELFILPSWFSARPRCPRFRASRGSAPGRGGLTVAVQAGFIVGHPGRALATLPDILSPRRPMIASPILGAAADAAVALWVERLAPALASAS
jgi:hypothetical protein